MLGQHQPSSGRQLNGVTPRIDNGPLLVIFPLFNSKTKREINGVYVELDPLLHFFWFRACQIYAIKGNALLKHYIQSNIYIYIYICCIVSYCARRLLLCFTKNTKPWNTVSVIFASHKTLYNSVLRSARFLSLYDVLAFQFSVMLYTCALYGR